MSLVKVIVTEAEPEVPGTGAFTASDAGNMGGIGIGILVAVLVAGVGAVGLVLRRRNVHNYGSRKGGFRISDKGKKIGGLFSILLLGSALVVPLAVGGGNAEQVFAGEGETELGITVDGNVVMNVEVKDNGSATAMYENQYVYINSSTTAGYTLAVYASSANLQSTSNKSISGLSGSGTAALSNNTWGIALSDPGGNTDSSVWRAVPTTKETALVIKDTSSATASGDSAMVYYGVKLTNATTAGEYSTTVNYVATAKVATP